MRVRRVSISMLVLMVIIALGFMSTVYASERPPEPTIGNRSLTNQVNMQINYINSVGDPKANNTPSSISSPQLMARIGYTLEPLGNATARFSGYTYSILSADTVSVHIYLQRWDGSNWLDISTAYDIRHNTDYASALKGYTGSGYLRLRTVHFVQKGEPSETRTETSDYIYIE